MTGLLDEWQESQCVWSQMSWENKKESPERSGDGADCLGLNRPVIARALIFQPRQNRSPFETWNGKNLAYYRKFCDENEVLVGRISG